MNNNIPEGWELIPAGGTFQNGDRFLNNKSDNDWLHMDTLISEGYQQPTPVNNFPDGRFITRIKGDKVSETTPKRKRFDPLTGQWSDFKGIA